MSSPPFTPTHLVPEGGMPAWDAPDPALAPVATVDEGLEVQVLERLGDWARAVFSNGWMAWVDGSRLLDLAPQTGGVTVEFAQQFLADQGEMPPPAAAVPTERQPISFSPALIGGAIVALSTILPWVKGVGLTANAYKIPVKFLFDPNTQSTGGGFSVGLMLLILGGAAAAGAMLPKYTQVQRMAAGGCLLIVSVYAGQLQRAASQLSQVAGQKVSLLSVIGFGAFVCLAGFSLFTGKGPRFFQEHGTTFSPLGDRVR